MGFSTHQPHQQHAFCERPKSEMRSVQTTIKTTHGAQFKSRNRRDRFLRACTPEATLLAAQGPASEPEVEPAAFAMGQNEASVGDRGRPEHSGLPAAAGSR